MVCPLKLSTEAFCMGGCVEPTLCVVRGEGWEFEQSTKDGPFDVKRDRRLVQYDADDLDEAMRLVRRHDPDCLEVTVIDPDGYRHRERVR